ncbi:Hypothetical predicted protein [Octopus vulgaris]|uniref:Uncharacterized protein n=1 Tax=Octopus vulgaris TaxID=6645 RepID=A0AA36AU48_OCTVU|nr:Hypothetical predicted protein [Octopus vulgaris]
MTKERFCNKVQRENIRQVDVVVIDVAVKTNDGFVSFTTRCKNYANSNRDNHMIINEDVGGGDVCDVCAFCDGGGSGDGDCQRDGGNNNWGNVVD